MFRCLKLQNKIRKILEYKEGEVKEYNHKKINMGACNDGKAYNTSVWNNNKEVCELFKDYFDFVSIVVCTWKGTVWGYIVPKDKFEDWWSYDNQEKGIGGDGIVGLKHLYCYDYSGEGTCGILTDLFHKCMFYEKGILQLEKKLNKLHAKELIIEEEKRKQEFREFMEKRKCMGV